jgi:hypothetical protein
MHTIALLYLLFHMVPMLEYGHAVDATHSLLALRSLPLLRWRLTPNPCRGQSWELWLKQVALYLV